jgi:glycosyltransferase involved in cell wall biosynthesis
MIRNKKVIVVLPAYNAASTLQQTYQEIPKDIVDDVILTDDASTDGTIQIAQRLGIRNIIRHDINKGYGSNQKTCYKKALDLGADIVIMLHPDYQYTPKLIPSMAYLIAYDIYPVVLGSRILGGGALRGGMPLYKYVANRLLTFFQNLMTGAKLSEYHTGYRAFSSEVLTKIDYDKNSNGFIFDNEILSQIIFFGFNIAEITCPAKYFKGASSINFINATYYGLGVIRVSIEHLLQRLGLIKLERYKFF